MTLAYSYFIHYCLYALSNQLSVYAYALVLAQPLLFFIIASMLFIPPEIILSYFEISQYFIDITLDYLWSTIFQLNTNVGYIVRLQDRDIIFDFSPLLEEESAAALLAQLQPLDMYCSELLSDEEMEDIDITSTDYENVDEDINYDLDDFDCSNFPEDY